jgi:hypothetical protein
VNWREVRGALVYERGRKYQHDRLYLQAMDSINISKGNTKGLLSF